MINKPWPWTKFVFPVPVGVVGYQRLKGVEFVLATAAAKPADVRRFWDLIKPFNFIARVEGDFLNYCWGHPWSYGDSRGSYRILRR